MVPKDIITGFDSFLFERQLQLEAIIIGGAALALLGVVARETRDCDVLAPELPTNIQEAAKEFAEKVREQGKALQDDWLNNGPTSMLPTLPAGWEHRLRLVFQGRSIVLHTLGRADLLKTKLVGLCDRGTDLGDCLALAPSAEEIDEASEWVKEQDANPDWPAYVEEVLADLRRRLGHGV